MASSFSRSLEVPDVREPGKAPREGQEYSWSKPGRAGSCLIPGPPATASFRCPAPPPTPWPPLGAWAGPHSEHLPPPAPKDSTTTRLCSKQLCALNLGVRGRTLAGTHSRPAVPVGCRGTRSSGQGQSPGAQIPTAEAGLPPLSKTGRRFGRLKSTGYPEVEKPGASKQTGCPGLSLWA